MSNSEEARENGSRSEEVFIILFNISHINIVLLWLFRRPMSILRTMRFPAPRRFFPSMLKALDNALMFRCWGGGGEMRSWTSSPGREPRSWGRRLVLVSWPRFRRFLSYLCSSTALIRRLVTLLRCWRDWGDWTGDSTGCRETCRRFLSYLCSSRPLPWSGDWCHQWWLCWDVDSSWWPEATGVHGLVADGGLVGGFWHIFVCPQYAAYCPDQEIMDFLEELTADNWRRLGWLQTDLLEFLEVGGFCSSAICSSRLLPWSGDSSGGWNDNPPHGLDLGSLEVFVQLWRVLVHCPGQEIRQLADRDWQMMAALEVFVTFLFVHNMSTI